MYRELVAECIKDNQWAKIGDPCTEEQLAEAEAYVGYTFPEELKALLREMNGDGWLLMSTDKIMEHVRCNREILVEAFDDIEEFKEAVDRHVPFATNGCGDWYCYRVLPTDETDPTAIYMWEHETFEHHIVAKDIPDLIRKYYNSEI